MRLPHLLIAAASAALPIPALAAAPPEQAVQSARSEEQRAPITILVSIDGFRPDYLDRGITPVLSQMAAEGVRASMIPSFPTKTFPNHNAVATGLRPDHNGIVGNNMVDPEDPKHSFWMGSQEPEWWDGADQIWITAEKAGIRTATQFWPGTTVKANGLYPTDWHQFSVDIGTRQRVDAIIDWARRPTENRPQFMILYIESVDSAGHDFGPFAPETDEEVAVVDSQIGRLRDALAEMGQPANIVIVSDHGMGPTSADRVIPLYRQLDGIGVPIEEGAYSSINPVPGKDAELSALLLEPHEHMECWPKAEIPARFEYGTHPRVPDYVCLAESGWIIRAKPPRPDAKQMKDGGTHGWDNLDPDMRATFIANGPAFRSGVTLPDFDNVDVNPLLREVLGLPQDRSLDGDLEPLGGALRQD
ncbi:putative AlkP superfamily pyrophosphatase or phosphodiesterase [Altererythrobacter atlanticus]|nr:ectonucleotide pyrophosphatase/phosphodiesterase [Croceibacterium atlanticum]MBB5733002.1 putative AlkP superfamily pyrophosphatase or phosphodiesterase [Croceibacterium atlanticum]